MTTSATATATSSSSTTTFNTVESMSNSTVIGTFDLLGETKKLNYLVTLTWIITPLYIFISLFGNITLIIATKKFGRIWKHPINILILNNSLCNLLIAGLFYPIYVATLSTNGEGWSNGRTFCYASLFLHYWVATVLHLSLILVVGTQLRIILRTLKQKKLKKKTAKRIMAYPWAVAFLLCIGITSIHKGDSHCIHGWIEYHGILDSNNKATIFITTLIISVCLVPKSMITLFYFMLSIKLRRKKTRVVWKPSYSILYARRIQQKRVTVRRMIRILVFFLVTFTPAHVQQILVLLNIDGKSNPIVVAIVTYVVNFFAFSHAWLSPIIVSMFNSKYRNYYKDLWRRMTCSRLDVPPTEGSNSRFGRKLSNNSEL